MIISLVVAVSKNNVIGKGGKMPWKIPEESRHFREITSEHFVLVGRKTYEKDIKRPLDRRVMMILTRDKSFRAEGCLTFTSFQDAVDFATKHGENELMVIGGREIYDIALPYAERIYMSRIQRGYEGDRTFPELDESAWTMIDRKDFPSIPPFETQIWVRNGKER